MTAPDERKAALLETVRRARGVEGPQGAGDAAQAPEDQKRAAYLGTVQRARARGTEEAEAEASEPMHLGEALQEAWDAPMRKAPWFGAGMRTKDAAEVVAATLRLQNGIQTKEDEDLIFASLAPQREKAWDYWLGAIATDLPGFAVEFVTSGGLVTLGKEGLRRISSEAVQASLQKAAVKLGLSELGKYAAGRAAKTGAKFVGNSVLQAAAAELIQQPFGGGMIQASTLREMLPEMALSEDEAGQLTLVMNAGVKSVAEALPVGVLDVVIEFGSERAGGALLGAIAPLNALQVAVVKAWRKAHPSTPISEFVSKVAGATGWHGPIGEFLEERAGGAARALTGVEPFAIETVIPEMEQMVGELLAFSIPTAGGAAMQTAFQVPGNLERPNQLAGAATEQKPEASMPQIIGETNTALERWSAQEGVQVRQTAQPKTPQAEGSMERAAARGLDVMWVEGVPEAVEGEETPDTHQLKGSAKLLREGLVALDVNSGEDFHEVLVHESLHDLAKKQPAVFAELTEFLGEVVPGGLATALQDFRMRYRSEFGKEMPEELAGEEAITNYAQTRAGLLRLTEAPEGRRALIQLVQNRRSLAQRLTDWMKEGLGRMGAKLRTTQEKRLDALTALLGEERGTLTKDDAQAALLLRDALDTALGFTAPSERRGVPPKFQLGAPAGPAGLLPSGPAAQAEEPGEPIQLLPGTLEMPAGAPPPKAPAAKKPKGGQKDQGKSASPKKAAPIRRRKKAKPKTDAQVKADEENVAPPTPELRKADERIKEGEVTIKLHLDSKAEIAPIPHVPTAALDERQGEVTYSELIHRLTHELRKADGYAVRTRRILMKWAEKLIGHKLSAAEEFRVEEALEAAAVARAREIAESSKSDHDKWNDLLALYKALPARTVRTSTSQRLQQFSTPIPLAWLASRLAHYRSSRDAIYEPTAGNGAMLMEAGGYLGLIAANEIEERRAAYLYGQFPGSVTTNDATEWAPDAEFDVILANPPFGSVLDKDLRKTTYTVEIGGREFETQKVDHAIVAKALSVLKDDGRAVLIIGAPHAMTTDEKLRKEVRDSHYRKGDALRFFRALYGAWNVVDHFTIPGELYKKQGAAWPIDIIVINGKGPAARPTPMIETPRVLEDWDEVRSLVPKRRDSGASGRIRPVRTADGGVQWVPIEAPGEGSAPDPLGGDTPSEGAGGGAPGGTGVREQPAPGPGSDRARGSDPATGERAGAGEPARRGVAGDPKGVPKGEARVEGGRPGGVARPDRDVGELTDDDLEGIIEQATEDAFGGKAVPDPAPELPPEEKLQVEIEAAKRREPKKTAPKPKGADHLDGLADLFAVRRVRPEAFDEEKFKKVDAAVTGYANENGLGRAHLPQILQGVVGYLKDAYGYSKEQVKALFVYLKEWARDVRDRTIHLKKDGTPDLPAEDVQRDLEREVAAKRLAEELNEDELQVRYRPSSDAAPIGTLAPSNLRASMEAALDRIREENGTVDDFVLAKLGWKDIATLYSRLAAEQVDAVALALDNLDRGKGLVLGDQTGVGKGRVVATLIDYVRRRGMLPIFVTRDPKLFADMFRDLYDVGVADLKPLFTHRSNFSVPYPKRPWKKGDADGWASMGPVPQKQYDAALAHATDTGRLPGEYDAIFTAYPQFNMPNGVEGPRHALLASVNQNAVWIMDESHNAVGRALTDREKAMMKSGKLKKRPFSEWLRGLLPYARGAIYSSATWAKNPHALSLYVTTDLPLMVEGSSDPAEAIATALRYGGVPLQQVISGMLAESGQMVRRERSFEGVVQRAVDVPMREGEADQISEGLTGLMRLDLNHMQRARETFIDVILASEGEEGGKDVEKGADSASTVGFANIMHNITEQALFAMKAEEVGKAAVREIEAGHACVVGCYNTFGSILDTVVSADPTLEVGSPMPDHSFRHLIEQYLRRLRVVSIKDDKGKISERRYITDEELKQIGEEQSLGAWEALRDKLAQLPFENMSMSPIDQIRAVIRRAGHSVDEITGRTLRVNMEDASSAFLEGRTSGNKAARDVIGRFQSGELDVVIVNSAGATGISLHAHEKNVEAGQKKRVMLIGQAPPNIDDFMQLLGRVHRTGQVVPPEYLFVFSEIPAEQRPKAVLMKKLASLNANTTASATSKTEVSADAIDFINKYGDRVWFEVLEESPTSYVHDMFLLGEMGWKAKPGKDPEPKITGLAKKASGRVMMLKPAHQADLYERVLSAYAERIALLKATGQYDLEAPTLELGARTVEVTEVVERTGPSVFQGAIVEETVDAIRLDPPLSWEEIQERVNKETDPEAMATGVRESLPRVLEEFKLDLRDAQEKHKKLITEAKQAVGVADAYAAGAEPTPEKARRLRDVANQKAKRADDQGGIVAGIGRRMIQSEKAAQGIQEVLLSAKPGRTVSLTINRTEVDATDKNLARGEEREQEAERPTVGVIADITQGKSKAGISPSSFKLKIYTADQTAAVIVPFSQILTEKAKFNTVLEATVRDEIDFQSSQGREQRSIVVGNIPKSVATITKGRGRIVFFRSDEGATRRGILLPRGQSAKEIYANLPVEALPEEVEALLEITGYLDTKDRVVTLMWRKNLGDYSLRIENKGSRAYRESVSSALGIELARKSGSTWGAEFTGKKQLPVLARALRSAQPERGVFAVHKTADNYAKAREVTDALRRAEMERRKAEEEAKKGPTAEDVFSVRKKVRKGSAFLGFDLAPETKPDRARRKVQDKDLRVRRLEEAIREAGLDITADESVYKAMERFPGRTERRLRKLQQEHIAPIAVLLAESGISIHDAGLYLYAKHAAERNKAIAKLHLDEWRKEAVRKARSQAVSEARSARRAVARLRTTLATTSNAATQKQLRVEIATQQKVMEAALDRAEHPLEHIGDPPATLKFQQHATEPGGSGLSDSEAAEMVERFEGGEQAAGFEAIGTAAWAMNEAARADLVDGGLLSEKTANEWAEQYRYYVPLRTDIEGEGPVKLGQGYEVSGPEAHQARGRGSLAHNPLVFSIAQARAAVVRGEKNEVGVRFLELARRLKKNPDIQVREAPEEDVPDETGEILPTEPTPGHSEFSVKENGKQVYVRVRDHVLLRALRNQGNEAGGILVRILGKVNRALAMVNTSLNPEFVLSNFARDLQTAGIHLAGEQSSEMAKAVIRDTMLGLPIAAAFRGLRGEEAKNEWDRYFKEMEESGALTGWFYVGDFAALEKDLAGMVKGLSSGKARRSLRALAQYIEDINRAVENGVRLSAYKHARERGMTVAEASSLAKNLTVNFNRKGEWGTVLNTLYLFYNASIQGSFRIFHALKSPNVRRIVYGLMVAGATLDVMNRATGGDDEYGIPYYDQIPEWVKTHNMIVMLPNTGGHYLKVPLPYGYNFFHTIGQAVAAMVFGDLSAAKATTTVAGAAWDSFFPFGSESTWLQRLSPTITDPMVQVATNRTFYGGPIRPAHHGFGPEPPRSTQHWDSVGEVWKAAAKGIGAVTLGDEYEPGAVDVSPETLEHVWNFALGGAGRFGGNMIGLLESAWKNEAPPLRDVPFVRRVVGAPDERQARDRYYRARETIQRADERLKGARATRDMEAVQGVAESHGAYLRMRPALRRAETRLRSLREARRKADTRDQEKAIEAKERGVREAFIALFQEHAE